jgi:hypothetical protein
MAKKLSAGGSISGVDYEAEEEGEEGDREGDNYEDNNETSEPRDD